MSVAKLYSKRKVCFVIFVSITIFVALIGSVNYWVLPTLFNRFVRIPCYTKSGIILSSKKIFYRPGRGLLLQGVELIQVRKDCYSRIRVRELEVRFKVMNFIRKRWVVDHFFIRDANVYFKKRNHKIFRIFIPELKGEVKRLAEMKSPLWGWSGELLIEKFRMDFPRLMLDRSILKFGQDKLSAENAVFIYQDQPVYLNLNASFQEHKFQVDFRIKYLQMNLLGSFNKKGGSAALISKQSCVISEIKFAEVGFKLSELFLQGHVGFVDLISMGSLFTDRLSNVIRSGSELFIDAGYGNTSGGWGNLKLDRLDIESFVLSDLLIKLRGAKDLLLVEKYTLKCCEGVLSGSGWGVLNSPLVYGGMISLDGLNLAYINQSKSKTSESVEGLLGGEVSFYSKGNSIDDLKAGGTLKIVNGKLWKVDLLKGILDVFQKVLPSLGNIQLTSGSARLLVCSGMLWAQEIRLVSSVVILVAEGKMGLRKKDLDLLVSLTLKPAGLNDKTFLSKLISGSLMVAGQQVWRARVEGDLNHPEVTPLFLSVFKPIKDLLKAPFKVFKRK